MCHSSDHNKSIRYSPVKSVQMTKILDKSFRWMHTWLTQFNKSELNMCKKSIEKKCIIVEMLL